MKTLIESFKELLGNHRVISGEDVANWKFGALKPVDRADTEVVVLFPQSMGSVYRKNIFFPILAAKRR